MYLSTQGREKVIGKRAFMKIKSKKLRIFLSRKLSVAAAVILIIMMLSVFIGPHFTRFSPTEINIERRLSGISSEHWLGTDEIGRDFFARIVHGGQITMGIALFGVALGASVGLLLGIVSGYYGGVLDALLSRFIDILMAIPGLMIATIALGILGPGGINTGIAVGVSAIPAFMRMTRATVISVKETDYVKSCRIMGGSNLRIIVKHILPSAWPMIVVMFTLGLGTAVLTSSALSFLGIGVNPPTPEWGALISSGRTMMLAFPLGILAPGLAITLVVMCTSLIGDGLRDALDPKTNIETK